MQIIGLNVTSLAFLGGAVGIGVGLGLQNIASNFASGLILLLERPIKVGDRIEVGNLNGDVVRIGGRSTWVRTNDNLIIIVPNAEFTTGRVTNWTANDRRVRFSFPVGVAYGWYPEQVRTILLALAAEHADVLSDSGARGPAFQLWGQFDQLRAASLDDRTSSNARPPEERLVL